ncbi:MAG TPA: helix-turn-helix domain-containing protein [Gemmataceae bacterium]|nr:helix-turn-helix domain-containing protein [Gemmataceae bacterium]
MRYRKSLAITSRHGKLIELIRSGEFSSPDLAKKLKVSEQTIYRDIDFLKQCGYVIRSEKHADGWAYHLLAEPATVSNGKESSRK